MDTSSQGTAQQQNSEADDEDDDSHDPVAAAQEHGLNVKQEGIPADISGLSPEAIDAFDEVSEAWSRHAPGITPTITSGTEMPDNPEARLEDSKHHTGDAFDLRTRDLTVQQKDIIVEELTVTLGNDYDVVDKSNHIHIEYDPD